MITTGSPKPSETFDAWFAVTVKVLKTKIAKLQVRDSGNLFDSVEYEVPGSSDFVNKGYLSFNLYGKFVDMGVGREFSRGNSGSVRSTRRRKEWYSRVFYAQVMRLREISQVRYGQKIASTIVREIESVKDLKYATYNSSSYRKQTLLG